MALASVDPYLSRRYVRGEYDCLSFARDVWRDATGEDVTEKLAGLMDPGSRHPKREHLRAFERLERPQDPCLVLMERPRSTAHVGVFLRGRVLHLSEQRAEFQPVDVASIGFSRVRFFR